ncbi:MAG: VIT and VWA domain-containing protein [Candidatus Acetothermia bacterium]|nr:VIT and VWA domain-containing protein [Candidatus Acetothermia bacterium]
MRKSLVAALVVGAVVAWLVPSLADGIIIPWPRPDIPGHPLRWLTIVYHRVTVTIQDGIATTKVDQAFRNDAQFAIEGTYVFPMPPSAVIQKFTLWVGGEPVVGEVLPANKAREIYLSYLRDSRDPALLEYIGRGAFQARIFPIAPGETRRIALEYVELLSPEAGLFRYRYPLSPERFSAKPLEEARIEVNLTASHPLGSVYSPTHTIAVTRDNPSSAQAVYLERDVLPDRDFTLYYGYGSEAVGADLVVYRPDSEPGWFLLLVTPPAVRDLAPLPKDLVLVIDRSGSMEGEKMNQAKAAAAFILERLGPGDRFGVIAFDDEIISVTPGLVPATTEEVAKAAQAVRALSARGMTNIHDALTTAMNWFAPADRPQYVLFLTDGLPTTGITDTAGIVKGVTSANRARARLFAFGVGYDVNAHLLDLLAEDNRGTTTYVAPGENLERALSNFYTKIAEPALADLRLTVNGVSSSEIYPDQLPDLFYGSQLAVFGRYVGSGPTTIVLTGKRGAEDVTFTYTQNFPERATEASFLPRLWAARKIGHLLNIIRLEGETKALVDQIVALATKYGIATPYTSFLVREEERAVVAPPSAHMMMSAGAPAVGAAKAIQVLTQADVVQKADFVREVDGRMFLFLDEIWRESTYEKGTPTVDVVYLSEAYFHLVDNFPDLAPILALGDKVVFQVGKTWVRIGESGLDELTPEVLAELRG